jgi:hypothetical protein
MKSRIDEKDLAHLEAFPGDQKAKVMRKIMSLQPTERTGDFAILRRMSGWPA